jgi:hypothetical protein
MPEELVNTRQILRELLRSTESGEIRWKIKWNASNSKSTFVYKKRVTETKYLIFVLTAKLPKDNSDLTILFGEKGNEKLVSVILPNKQRLILDLAQELMIRFNGGQIPYLRESWGGIKKREDKISPKKDKEIEIPFKVGDVVIHKVDGEGVIEKILDETKNQWPKGTVIIRLNKYKNSTIKLYLRPSEAIRVLKKAEDKKTSGVNENIGLISNLIQNTEDGKLTWEDTDFDVNSALFTSIHFITKLKSLTFSVKTNTKSTDKDKNLLRVILKRRGEGATFSSSVLKSLRLIDHPQLVELFKLLNRKILDRDYISPYEKKSVSVTVNSVEEYRDVICETILSVIKKFPLNRESEEHLEEVGALLRRCRKATTYDTINSILNRVKTLEDLAIKSEENRYRENYLG